MFENPIGAAIVAIRIGRNEDYEAHGKGSALSLSGLCSRLLISAFGGKPDISLCAAHGCF